MSTHLVYLVVNFVSLSDTPEPKKGKLNREKYTEIKIQKKCNKNHKGFIPDFTV